MTYGMIFCQRQKPLSPYPDIFERVKVHKDQEHSIQRHTEPFTIAAPRKGSKSKGSSIPRVLHQSEIEQMREWGGPNAVKISVILFKGENARGRDPSCMHQFVAVIIPRNE